MLTKEEKYRYSRHITLEQVGIEGQEKLKSAKVLVIGAGGLGCPVLQYLTAAGVGTIGVADDDLVDESNLQRQILYHTGDVGKQKADIAIQKLKAQNHFVNFVEYKERVRTQNALQILRDFDIVIDGTDNFPTRYLVNDASVILDKPLVFGSIFKFDGQVAVFNYQGGPSYRCLFPDPPKEGEAANCSETGVMGILPAIVGTKMASECLKIILGIGEVLSGKLEVVDMLGNKNSQISVSRNNKNFDKKVLEKDYDQVCGIGKQGLEIMPIEFNRRLNNGEIFQLIDVREQVEYDICAIENSRLIPLGELALRYNEVLQNIPTVVICHHGGRSMRAIHYLASKGYHSLISLKGGIHAWALQVDENMAVY